MAITTNRLKAVHLKAPKPGLHADGGGLYLRVTTGKNAGQRWVFIYRRPVDGKRCELGLGGSANVSLATARELARKNRDALAAGRDPRIARVAMPTAAASSNARPTFGEFAAKYVTTMATGWKNEKHRTQWSTTIKTHAALLKAVPVDEVSTDHILAVLSPIWPKIPETADRLRGASR